MITHSITSATLLAGLKNPQDSASWHRFYDRYVPMLLAVAKRARLQDADAQDVVGAALADFTRAYREGKYDRTKGRLRDWLKGILRNQIRREFSRKAVIARHEANGAPASDPEAALDSQSAFGELLDDAYEREWQLERLNQALAILRGESTISTYQAFDLYAVKGWPAKKVADFLGIKTEAVYQAKSRSTARLREILVDVERNEE